MKNSFPGPSDYNTMRENSSEIIRKSYNAISFQPHGSIHIKSRELLNHPGPGAYKIPCAKSGTAFTFAQKYDFNIPHSKPLNRRLLIKRDTHSPNYIAPTNYIGKSPGVKINPPSITKRKKEKEIGPGTYIINNLESGPRYTIGERRSLSIQEEVIPGPGAYKSEKVMKYFQPILRKSIIKRNKPKEEFETPGPATYSPRISSTIPSCK